MNAEPRLLESSPFYARLEAREGDVHALAESGDFARFHSPLVRWMADFRTHRDFVAQCGLPDDEFYADSFTSEADKHGG